MRGRGSPRAGLERDLAAGPVGVGFRRFPPAVDGAFGGLVTPGRVPFVDCLLSAPKPSLLFVGRGFVYGMISSDALRLFGALGSVFLAEFEIIVPSPVCLTGVRVCNSREALLPNPTGPEEFPRGVLEVLFGFSPKLLGACGIRGFRTGGLATFDLGVCFVVSTPSSPFPESENVLLCLKFVANFGLLFVRVRLSVLLLPLFCGKVFCPKVSEFCASS